MKAKNPSNDALRKNAEAQIKNEPICILDLTMEKAKILMHELEVHQIELKMQNQELREAQQQLEKARDEYCDLFDFAPVGYLILDERGVINNINLTACYLLGIDRLRVKGKPLSAYLSSDDANMMFINLRQAFKTGTLDPLEFTIKRKDNTYFNALLNGTIDTDQHLDVPLCRVAMQDITKDKLVSDKLTQSNEELQKTNSELDRFVYSASHDLRSPLTSLRGLIQILEMQIDSSEKVDKKPIYLMTKTINKMDKFISDILDYSLNTRAELAIEKINFEEQIKSSWEDLEYMDIDFKPKLTLDIKQNTDFFSDPKRISIILNNLISNAIKYHDKNKTDHFINISIATDNKKVTIVIEDNGIGISEEYIDKIFHMFHRVTSLSTGSGMGLYIVKETVEKLKGAIDVVSELEKGTKFTIKIPNSI